MAKAFTDNPEKRVVRDRWNFPVLDFLHRTYGIKYRYFGLPGPDMLDVLEWKHMIDEVVAFQIPDQAGNLRASMEQLRRTMRLKSIRGNTYFGSFEDVVLRRQDNDGIRYVQNNVITLYNLDFCNEICSPIRTGGTDKVVRFQAIRRIINDQSDCYAKLRAGSSLKPPPSMFIMLLTVRNQISVANARKYLRNSVRTKLFRAQCESLERLPPSGQLMGTHSWVLKALIYDMLCTYFGTPHISALFFPSVLYTGTPIVKADEAPVPSPMIHWMVLGNFADPSEAVPNLSPEDFLQKSSGLVSLQTQSIAWRAQSGEQPDTGAIDPLKWLHAYGGDVRPGLNVPGMAITQ